MSGRVAILGMGAIGHVLARTLEGRAELVKVNRTNAPLRKGEPPVDAAIVATNRGVPVVARELEARRRVRTCTARRSPVELTRGGALEAVRWIGWRDRRL
jgi:hypothetical protein